MTYQPPKRHPLKDIYAGRHDSHPYHRDLFQSSSSGDAVSAATASSAATAAWMMPASLPAATITSTALPSVIAAPATAAVVGDVAFAYAPPPPPPPAAAVGTADGNKWYRDVNGNDLRDYPFKGRPDGEEQQDRDLEDKINQQYQRYQMFGPPAGSQNRPSTTPSAAFSSSTPTPLRFAGASSTIATKPRLNATATAVTQRLHPSSMNTGAAAVTARPWTTSSVNQATSSSYRPLRYHHPSLFTPQHTQQYFPRPTVDAHSGLHVYNAAEISWPSSHINYLLSAGARQQDAALGFQPTASYEYHYQRFFPNTAR